MGWARSGLTSCIEGSVKKRIARGRLPGAGTPKAGSEDPVAIKQFKMWLKGLSPMIWRRVQVSPDTTIGELRGIFQVASAGREFACDLRAVRYGSHELAARSPDIALGDRQLRQGARFAYEYDLNIPWEQRFLQSLDAEVGLHADRHPPMTISGLSTLRLNQSTMATR